MRLQLRFQGDYAREFGPHPLGYSRVWKAYYVIDGEHIIGEVSQEPNYTDGGVYYIFRTGEYSVRVKTRKSLYTHLRKGKNENL